MNILFFASQKEREEDIANHFAAGIKVRGDHIRIFPTCDIEGIDPWADIAVSIGIKGWSRLLMETYMSAGKHFIVIDKGYVGGPSGPRSKYMRVSIDALQPHAYFQKEPRPDDRIRAFNVKLQPDRKGSNVLLAGGSLKYALWHRFPSRDNLDPATAWASMVAGKLRRRTKKPIVYRPKPSWADAQPVSGTQFSRPPTTIDDELRHAWCCVSYGSNAGVDALIAGVPNFVLGDGIVRSLALTDTGKIEDPYYPSEELRWNLLSCISYCQFSFTEFENGFAWDILRPQIEQMPEPTKPIFFGDEK